jgi:hypothetical protein
VTTARTPIGSLMTVALLAYPVFAEKPERPEGPPGTVTLSLAEYDRLAERAARPPKLPSQPPVASVLSRGEAHLKAEGSDVRGTFTLEGEVLRSGPTLVPLLPGGTVLDARLAGKPLPLVSDASGLGAVITGPGPFSITLEWGTAIVQEPGQASFVLPAPSAGSVRVSLDVLGGTADVRVTRGLVTQRSSSAGRTTVEATLDPGSLARFTWSARDVTAAAPRESRFLSDVKTLVTVGEAELRMAALVDVNVVQGEPGRFVLKLPSGFEVTSVSGATLDKTEEGPGALSLLVRDATLRRHQFLVTLERANGGGSFAADAELPSVDGAQRETGEAAVEGLGTLELVATEGGGLRRMDVRETAEALRGLAREALLAAFRYQRRADVQPKVGLDVKRYPNAAVLAALAERAVVTTLATAEGRTLTEVSLTVRNHAQPFLKVALPEGSTLLTAEVAGEGVKPVKGDDGTRVPLLRTGFRPDGPYAVSFVYVQPGAPFAKRGDARLAVPRMDVPIDVLEWELFLPDRYRVRRFDGEALPASLLEGVVGGIEGGVAGGVVSGEIGLADSGPMGAGRIWGVVKDNNGSSIPGATVSLTGPGVSRRATTDSNGRFVLNGVPAGTLQVRVELAGFSPATRRVNMPEGASMRLAFAMKVGDIREMVEVVGSAPVVDTSSSTVESTISGAPESSGGGGRRKVKSEPEAQNAPSANVFNLQRRIAGVLPVRMDIPHAGVSYRFMRPLVLDEETSVSFSYKTR